MQHVLTVDTLLLSAELTTRVLRRIRTFVVRSLTFVLSDSDMAGKQNFDRHRVRGAGPGSYFRRMII